MADHGALAFGGRTNGAVGAQQVTPNDSVDGPQATGRGGGW